MLRALARRLTIRVDQLELTFSPEEGVLARLRARGLRGISSLALTTNSAVVVSFRGDALRMHEALAHAPAEVLDAVVAFVQGRGAMRRAARRILVSIPIPGRRARAPRRELPHPDDAKLVQRLRAEFERLNARYFGGFLSPIEVRVSRRLRRRLGHYAPAATHGTAEIAISHRHIKRDGWEEAIETLVHEMIHQWQEESGLPVDHGPVFRRKARELGVQPRARRKMPSRERFSGVLSAR